MEQSDEYREPPPACEQPDGVAPFGDERTMPLEGLGPDVTIPAGGSPFSASAVPEDTLPIVDLYPTAQNWSDSAPYPTDQAPWNPGPSPVLQQRTMAPDPYHGAARQPEQQPPPYPLPYTQQSSPLMPVGPYGAQGPYMMVRAEHPQATTVLVLGAVSIAVPVLSFVAWYMGAKAKREIESGAPFAYAGNLKTGHIIGKVMGILTIVGGSLYVLLMIVYVVVMIGLLSL
ncbi:hypothetical protein [Tessaracoccus antarcticus]|uniref:DUF4190 domain-containing protein n=1 Tax=Tessaracoccus antarcticus TaxID=2479848 RepID=A0A3M0GJS1_9ACTN|nr:hypothetical protein [Tessaracoccus antarcticus]RMB61873.1 hypothetical protein EAX62_04530 [Tessaracoccus antarcticus]